METIRISHLFKNIYDGNPWAASTIFPLLNTINAKQAATKVLPNCNTIWEIVNHITRWRENVLLRIQGKIRPAPAHNYFTAVKDTSEAAWHKTLTKLHNSQENWITVLKGFNNSYLETLYAADDFNYYEHIHGILHHDAYHLGQIVMLLKFINANNLT